MRCGPKFDLDIGEFDLIDDEPESLSVPAASVTPALAGSATELSPEVKQRLLQASAASIFGFKGSVH